MNTGVITSRYANAFLKLVGESPDGDKICSQVLTLEKALNEVELLRSVIENPVAYSIKEKIDFLNSALDGEIHPSLKSFLYLIMNHGRGDFLRLILHAFADKYFHEKKILHAKLVTAVPSDRLEAALAKYVSKLTGCKVIIESRIDPSIIGGFMVTIDNERIDASVKGQLESFRRQFVKQNKRLI